MRRMAYLAAAGLALLAAAVHVVVLGPEIYDAIMRRPLMVQEKAVLAVVWHSVAVVLLLCALALGWASGVGNPQARAVGMLAGGLLLVMGGLYLSAAWFWFRDLLALPYWTFILPAGLFALFAAS